MLCRDGFFQDEPGQDQCKQCDAVAGSMLPIGSVACNPCPPGSIVSFDGSCALCPAGTISNGGSATNCTACTTGSSQRGASYCDDCKAGTFLNLINDPPTCDACPPGFVSNNAALLCTPCGLGTFQNSTECLACPSGRYGATTGLANARCSGECHASVFRCSHISEFTQNHFEQFLEHSVGSS